MNAALQLTSLPSAATAAERAQRLIDQWPHAPHALPANHPVRVLLDLLVETREELDEDELKCRVDDLEEDLYAERDRRRSVERLLKDLRTGVNGIAGALGLKHGAEPRDIIAAITALRAAITGGTP